MGNEGDGAASSAPLRRRMIRRHSLCSHLGLLSRRQHVNELSVAAVAEGFADKSLKGATICLDLGIETSETML